MVPSRRRRWRHHFMRLPRKAGSQMAAWSRSLTGTSQRHNGLAGIRASVLASPDFRGFPGMFGLARTLALPNWLFSHKLVSRRILSAARMAPTDVGGYSVMKYPRDGTPASLSPSVSPQSLLAHGSARSARRGLQAHRLRARSGAQKGPGLTTRPCELCVASDSARYSLRMV